jgi:hypothetical protein
MKFAFGTRPHYIISVRGVENISLHTGSGHDGAIGATSYDTVTNCMDDLFQRMNKAGPTKLWAAIAELNQINNGSSGLVRGGWWITIVQQDEENGIENEKLNVIAEGTAVDIYNQLLPHLHMMRTTL